MTKFIYADIEHPGLILKEEFLDPLKISMNQLALAAGVPRTRIHAIVHGKRGITAETSVRIGRALGVSDLFFLNLQHLYEKALANREVTKAVNDVTPIMKKA